MYLLFHANTRYALDPSQQDLIIGLRLAQMWNVPRLFCYSFDRLRNLFRDKRVHPVIVLAVAQENRIPSLIRPMVKALAEPAMSLSSWCLDREVLLYMQVDKVGAIARMKEQLYLARISILDIPPVVHGGQCIATNSHQSCELVWEFYWNTAIGKKVRKLADGRVCSQLWLIRSDLLKAPIPGMGELCRDMTVEKVGSYLCWFSDSS